MVATLTTGAPRCLRASGCTSRCSHWCKAAIMSQVRAGGGENAICGLLPMLTSRMGAAVPHSVPSRIGVSGKATTSSPLSIAVQRAWASSISCFDQVAGACGGASAALPFGRTLGQACSYFAAGGGNLAASGGGDVCCAVATGAMANAHRTAAVAQRATCISERPLLSVWRSRRYAPHESGSRTG